MTTPAAGLFGQYTATVRVRDLVRKAAAWSRFSEEEILGSSRRRDLCRLRFHIWKRATDAGRSVSEIGRVFQRDHTTIIYGVSQVSQSIRLPVPDNSRSGA